MRKDLPRRRRGAEKQGVASRPSGVFARRCGFTDRPHVQRDDRVRNCRPSFARRPAFAEAKPLRPRAGRSGLREGGGTQMNADQRQPGFCAKHPMPSGATYPGLAARRRTAHVRPFGSAAVGPAVAHGLIHDVKDRTAGARTEPDNQPACRPRATGLEHNKNLCQNVKQYGVRRGESVGGSIQPRRAWRGWIEGACEPGPIPCCQVEG